MSTSIRLVILVVALLVFAHSALFIAAAAHFIVRAFTTHDGGPLPELMWWVRLAPFMIPIMLIAVVVSAVLLLRSGAPAGQKASWLLGLIVVPPVGLLLFALFGLRDRNQTLSAPRNPRAA